MGELARHFSKSLVGGDMAASPAINNFSSSLDIGATDFKCHFVASFRHIFRTMCFLSSLSCLQSCSITLVIISRKQ